MQKLFFDLIGPKQDAWLWQLVGENGHVILRSKSTFPYYLHALADARANGCDQEPSFRPPNDLPRPVDASASIRRAAEMLEKQ